MRIQTARRAIRRAIRRAPHNAPRRGSPRGSPRGAATPQGPSRACRRPPASPRPLPLRSENALAPPKGGVRERECQVRAATQLDLRLRSVCSLRSRYYVYKFGTHESALVTRMSDCHPTASPGWNGTNYNRKPQTQCESRVMAYATRSKKSTIYKNHKRQQDAGRRKKVSTLKSQDSTGRKSCVV